MPDHRLQLGITLSLAGVLWAGRVLPQVPPTDVARCSSALREVDRDVRRGAAEALAEPGPKAAQAIPDLINALRDLDPAVRWHSAVALGSIGPEAVAPLIGALRKGDGTTRGGAALALARIGPRAKAALWPLVDALIDRDATIRERAAEALGALGPDARPAVPALVRALSDEDPYVNGRAAEALGRVGAGAVPALVQALSGGSQNVRWCAAIALGRMGAEARDAAPALARSLADKDENVRWCAAVALGVLGPQAKDAVPALVESLHDMDEDVRWAANLALDEVRRDTVRKPPEWPATVATIDRLTPELMKELHVPGVSIALVADLRVVWSRSYGVADVRTGEPVTRETRFEACSMSKPVFAYLVMKLVEEGKLDLDRPLTEYLKEAVPPAQADKELITARMVLTHTTGFPDWRKGYEERGGPLPVRFKPGSRYGYSGEGVFYLQRVVEHITGEPLEVYAQRTLFEPVGLGQTSYVWTQELDGKLASGHTAEGKFLRKTKYTHANAAYSLYTTAEDYARFLIEIVKPDRSGSHSLSSRSVEAMLGHQVEVTSRDPVERPGGARGVAVYRSLGWSVNSSEAGDIVHHSGANSSGFRCFSQFSPGR
ncbi:MAG: serine hydrolase, partial [Acidobacteriia bacterium]|nr:serine hydrolase [Terriglobia bacterium]